jgi:hypothetical protein
MWLYPIISATSLYVKDYIFDRIKVDVLCDIPVDVD